MGLTPTHGDPRTLMQVAPMLSLCSSQSSIFCRCDVRCGVDVTIKALDADAAQLVRQESPEEYLFQPWNMGLTTAYVAMVMRRRSTYWTKSSHWRATVGIGPDTCQPNRTDIGMT